MNKVKTLVFLFMLFSISQAANTVIDDFAKGSQFTKTRDAWFAYVGGATVSNPLNGWGNPEAVSTGWAGLSGLNLSAGDDDWSKYAGFGIDFKGNGGKYNLSECTGFSYKYKGEAHRFNLELESGTTHYVSVEKSDELVTNEVDFADFAIADWTGDEALDFSKIARINWNVPDVVPVIIVNGSLQIKDFECIGGMALPEENSIEWADASTLFSQENYANGNPIDAKVVVKMVDLDTGNEKTLVKGKDYTVAYSDNTEIGPAIATITGIGNYSGTKTLTFEIVTLPTGGLFWNAAKGDMQLNTSYDFIDDDGGYWFGYEYRNARIYTQYGILSNGLNNWREDFDWDNEVYKEALTPDGIQARLTVRNGFWDNPSEAMIGVSWKEPNKTGAAREVNMREFNGLCFTYNLEGENPLEVRLEMDDTVFPWSESYDRYRAILQPGNHSVDIPWSAFYKEWGITKLQDAIEHSTGVNIMLRTKTSEMKQATFTLREFGAAGSCTGVNPPAADLALELATGFLSNGGLLWDFATAKEGDPRVQTPGVQRDPDVWESGGYWWSAVNNSASVFQKNGTTSIELKDGYGNIVDGGVLDNEYGLQVRLATESGGSWDWYNQAFIGFVWNENEVEENISGFDGFCLVYNLTGDDLTLQLGWDGTNKYPWDEYGQYHFNLPAGNHSIDIPWTAFKQTWGLGEFSAAIEEAVNLIIMLNSSTTKSKESLFTLRQLGSYGSCSKATPAPAKYEGNGLVPPPAPQDLFFDITTNWDAQLKDNAGNKTNTAGWFGGYTYGHSENSWVSNNGDNFIANYTENGLQVGLIADAGDGAGFSFDWNNDWQWWGDDAPEDKVGSYGGTTENLLDFGGLCLTYAMEGSAPHFDVELRVEEGGVADYGWSTFFAQVPNTNGKKAVVNLPWTSFYKPWGATTKFSSVSESRGITFRIDPAFTSENGPIDAQITLLQFGKLGACRAGDEEAIEFLSPKAPEPQVSPKPFIGKTPEIAMPLIGNLQLSQVGKGLNVLSNSGAKLTLFNLKGGVVMQKNLGAGQQVVSLQNLKSGIYIAQVRHGSQVKTIKVSK